MYWTVYGVTSNSGSIEAASMDGTERTVLHNTSLIWPYALTIDIETQTLYWADDVFNKVESSGVDGSNRRLIPINGLDSPYSLAILNTTLYLTDRFRRSVEAIYNFNGSTVLLADFCAPPYNVRVVHPSLQPEGLVWGSLM